MIDRFTILHVCTGNIGRSPMAEYLMRLHLTHRLSAQSNVYEVSSAGTSGCTASPMEPFALLALSAKGVDGSDFHARELTEDMIASADLVLTATIEHRADVVTMVPAAVRRTFALREFARLASLAVDEPAVTAIPERPAGEPDLVAMSRAVVEKLGPLRGAVRPLPGDDDLIDPLGAPSSVYAVRADEIDIACRQVVALLTADHH